MGRYRRKRMHKNIKDIKKKYRTKRRTKDIDQIHEDLLPSNAAKLQNQGVDHDLPGCGQHYCLTCARHFINEGTLKEHFKTKPHKRRLQALKQPVYSQKEAEMAAGMGNYVLTQPSTTFTDTEMNSAEPSGNDCSRTTKSEEQVNEMQQ